MKSLIVAEYNYLNPKEIDISEEGLNTRADDWYDNIQEMKDEF